MDPVDLYGSLWQKSVFADVDGPNGGPVSHGLDPGSRWPVQGDDKGSRQGMASGRPDHCEIESMYEIEDNWPEWRRRNQ